MRTRVRVDSQTSEHLHFSVFVNGANCGHLCMGVGEAFCFFNMLKAGETPGNLVEFAIKDKVFSDPVEGGYDTH